MLANESIVVEILVLVKVRGKITKINCKQEANATRTLESTH